MLVLTRKVSEELVIGDDVRIRLIQVKGGQVRLGIEAPRHVSVRRTEVADPREPAGRAAETVHGPLHGYRQMAAALS